MNYPHISGRIFNAPLLIHPQKLDAMIAGLGGRLLGVKPMQIQHVGEVTQAATLSPEMFTTALAVTDCRAVAFSIANGRPGCYLAYTTGKWTVAL